MDISLEAWNTQDTMHISNDVQEEGRSGLQSCKSSVQQSLGIPGQSSGKLWIVEQGEKKAYEVVGEGGSRKGKNQLKCK